MDSHYYLIEESELRTILAGYFENNNFPEPYARARNTIAMGTYLPCPDKIAEKLLNKAYEKKWGKR